MATEFTFILAYVQPAAAVGEIFRTTTYEIETGTFTGTSYTLTLNNDLESNYFTMISGPSVATGSRAPNADRVRVTADPHSNFGSSTASNQLELTRNNSTNNWIGALTVVECLSNCTTKGFVLSEVLETSLAAGSANTLQTVNDTLSANHTAQTVPFGGRFGGGMESSGTDANAYATTVGIKITKTSTNQITYERYGAENRAPSAGTVTTFITEWGSEWNVQNVNVTGTNAGIDLNATNEYNTAAITSVTRDNTFVWGGGHARDDGLGDGALGQVITLGDGVTQNATETLVAVGAEGGQISPGRDFQVYVLEHPDLAVDYQFRTRGDQGAGSGYQELTQTVDAPLNPETRDNVSTSVRYTEGQRVPLFYNTSGGVGQAYSRTGAWGLRHTGDTSLTYWRAYAGQPITGWFQSIDFGDVKFVNVDNQQHAYRWRDDSIDLNTSGGWLAAENTGLSAQAKNTKLRLRIEAANFGITPEVTGKTYELQYGVKASTCDAVMSWTGVSDVANDAFDLYNSPFIDPDGEVTTTGLLANSEGFIYVNGEGREVGDTTNTIGPIANDSYTELEYALTPTDNALTGETYCFRLFDTTASLPLDDYNVYPELTIDSMNVDIISGLGEAGTFSSEVDGGWTTVNFAGSYTTPVVVGTTNTQNGQNALVFEARNVMSTSAEMRVCESEGATSNGCDTHASETVGYMVVDAAVAATTDGIEAGTFTADGDFDTDAVTTAYPTAFSSTPYAFANINSNDTGDGPVEVMVRDVTTTNFAAGLCRQLVGPDLNSCDTTQGSETVGWVAIEPGNLPFSEQTSTGDVSIGNSTWTSISFGSTFPAAPVVIVESQTDNGGEDAVLDEARLVTTTGADIRFCEMESLDTCDSHNADDIAWFAIEPGQFSTLLDIDLNGYRFYESINNVTPTTAIGPENTTVSNIDSGDVIRLRMALQAGDAQVVAGSFGLTLQYSAATTCSAAGSWTDVGGIGSGSIWRGFNVGGSTTDGSTLPSSLLDGGGNVLQTYEESNDGSVANTIAAGLEGEWDWVIENNGAANFTDYCFRVVTDDDQAINYNYYPQLKTSTGVVNLAPNAPANLDQERTSTAQISVGEVINETTVVFKADVSDQNTNDVLQLCIEVDEVGTAFSNTEDSCGATVTYTGTALEASLTLSSFVDGAEYHWQARVKDTAGLYSVWVSFGGNAESAADFSIDDSDPTGLVYDGTTNGVDIEFNDGSLDELSANWNITDTGSGLSQFEYSVGTSPDGTDVVGWTNVALATAFTETGLLLETSEIYYVNVRATDVAGNQVVINADGQQVAPTITFSTSTAGGVTFDNLNAGNGFTDTESTVLTTSTNARNGYAVRAYQTGSLENALLSTIGGFDGGTYAAPDTWQGGDTGFGYTSSDTLVDGVNRFNAPTCPGGGSGGPCFAAFATTAPGDIIADNPGIVSGTPITNEQFTITHRVTTDAAQQQGTYQATLIFQATAVY